MLFCHLSETGQGLVGEGWGRGREGWKWWGEESGAGEGSCGGGGLNPNIFHQVSSRVSGKAKRADSVAAEQGGGSVPGNGEN